ncbi:MAG: DrmE family protein [Acidimicrobiales bacterium]
MATSVRVLAYTPEGPVESVARGYDEVDLIRRAVALQAEREAWTGRAYAKDLVWSELSGDARLVLSDDAPTRVEGGGVGVRVTTTPSPPDVPPGLWGGDGWLADLEPTRSDDPAAADRGGVARSGSSVVGAVRITFDDGRWTLAEVAGTVTRFRPGTGAPEPAYPVSSVKPGDRLLFFDGDSRKDLLAKVIEVAVEVPALAVAAGWVAHWRRTLGVAYRVFGSYPAFADALLAEGCTVQDQTVRLWVIGVTIGPEDDDDVRRVGVVMDDPVLRDRHDEVCRAIHSLRGAHVRLSQRLSDLARKVGSAAEAGLMDADEVVDERSGLTVADFRESVDILTVSAVESAGDVPYVLIGTVNGPESEEEDEEDD